jgi:molybdopterin-guanine dinucleotide biosynthesis protein A
VSRGAAPGLIAGVFVGGRGTRMAGAAKGQLAAPGGGTLVDRWRALLRDAGVEVVLVGRHEGYASLDLEVLDDEPRGVGPLGGLIALLRRARGGRALALACDMPFVSSALLGRLIAAPPAVVVAPRRDGHWEPLCARYDAPGALPHALRRLAAGAHSLQLLLDEAGTMGLPIDPAEAAELHDWDEPADLR